MPSPPPGCRCGRSGLCRLHQWVQPDTVCEHLSRSRLVRPIAPPETRRMRIPAHLRPKSLRADHEERIEHCTNGSTIPSGGITLAHGHALTVYPQSTGLLRILNGRGLHEYSAAWLAFPGRLNICATHSAATHRCQHLADFQQLSENYEAFAGFARRLFRQLDTLRPRQSDPKLAERQEELAHRFLVGAARLEWIMNGGGHEHCRQ